MDIVPKILIVDDLKVNRMVLQKILAEITCEVIEADSGAEALNLVEDHDFALLLLDVHMPVMNGFELAAKLGENSKTADKPIIFVTAAASDVKSQLQGYKFGAVDYIEKPIEIPILLAKVKIFLELYEKKAWLSSAVEELQSLNAQLQNEIERRKEMEEQLRTMALTDVLTGLSNRRAMTKIAAKELARVRREGGPLFLAIMDVDFFKKVNDTYGHEAGDEALRVLGRLSQDFFRESDTVARIGGEEFAILCPASAGTEASVPRFDEFRTRVSETEIVCGEDRLNITVSIGVVTSLEENGSFESMFKIADKRLYHAKANGRNQVVLQ